MRSTIDLFIALSALVDEFFRHAQKNSKTFRIQWGFKTGSIHRGVHCTMSRSARIALRPSSSSSSVLPTFHRVQSAKSIEIRQEKKLSRATSVVGLRAATSKPALIEATLRSVRSQVLLHDRDRLSSDVRESALLPFRSGLLKFEVELCEKLAACHDVSSPNPVDQRLHIVRRVLDKIIAEDPVLGAILQRPRRVRPRPDRCSQAPRGGGKDYGTVIGAAGG